MIVLVTNPDADALFSKLDYLDPLRLAPYILATNSSSAGDPYTIQNTQCNPIYFSREHCKLPPAPGSVNFRGQELCTYYIYIYIYKSWA